MGGCRTNSPLSKPIISQSDQTIWHLLSSNARHHLVVEVEVLRYDVDDIDTEPFRLFRISIHTNACVCISTSRYQASGLRRKRSL